MRRRQLWLCVMLTFALGAAARSQSHWDWLGSFHIDRELEFKDPAFLYLVFEDKSLEEFGGVMTWLHPILNHSGSFQEAFMPSEEKKSKAVEYRLMCETANGYEVSFQPIDPITKRPLPLRDQRVIFLRTTETIVSLTNKVRIFGFYGDPSRERPSWASRYYSTEPCRSKSGRSSRRTHQ